MSNTAGNLVKGVHPNSKPKLEKHIQREICDWLSSRGFFFWRSNNVPVFARSNDGKMRFRSLPKYTPRGLPDIMVVVKGMFVGIEVKRVGEKLRPEQESFKGGLCLNQGFYITVNSLADVQEWFEIHG
jgi:hypothetical protein